MNLLHLSCNLPKLSINSRLFSLRCFLFLLFGENQTSGKLISYLINILSSETVFLLYFFNQTRQKKSENPIVYTQSNTHYLYWNESSGGDGLRGRNRVRPIETARKKQLYHSHGKFQLFRSLDSVFWLFQHQLKEMIINKSNTRKETSIQKWWE